MGIKGPRAIFLRAERGHDEAYSYKQNQLSVRVMGKEWVQGQGTWMGPEASWAGKNPFLLILGKPHGIMGAGHWAG